MGFKTVEDQTIRTRDGEIKIKAGATVYTVEEKENYKKIREIESMREYIHIDSANHGGFTFLKTNNDILKSMKPETVGRLVYLSTYLDFDTQQLMVEPYVPMKKKDLQYFLNIGETKVKHFCNECSSYGVMRIDDKKHLYLNDIFFKGKSTSKERIKIYCKTIRELYRHLPPKHHKYFGYIIQLVPWINYEWNIICKNPLEYDYKKIIPLSVKEICGFIGYNEKNSYRFKEAITKCFFEWGGQPAAMCGTITTDVGNGMREGLVVNPHLIFHGTDLKKVEGIAIFFTLGENSIVNT